MYQTVVGFKIFKISAALSEKFWRISLNVTDDAIAELYETKFSTIPSTVFDETLRHVEQCNSAISQIPRNLPKFFVQCS